MTMNPPVNNVSVCSNRYDNVTYLVSIQATIFHDNVSNKTINSQTGYVWLAFTVIILAANFFVLLKRCTRRTHRSSISSILVINLAVADFFLGVQMLIYLILFKWPCFLLGNPKLFNLIQILCTVSAMIEMTSIPLSGLITTTMAFYYATFILPMFSSIQGIGFSRTKILIGCIIEWALAIAVGSVMAASVNQQGFLVRKELPPLAGQTIIRENYILMACVPIINVGSLYKDNSPFHKLVTEVPIFVTFALLVLSFLAAIAYSSIYKSISSQPPPEIESVSHFRLRITVISLLPVIIWIVYVFLALGGLINPFALTIFSPQFIRGVQNFWIKTCRKKKFEGEHVSSESTVKGEHVSSESKVPKNSFSSDSHGYD